MSSANTIKTAVLSRTRNAGMSLVEVMISLAISSTLLAAVAAAFTASASAIEHNDQFVRAAQAARISVSQIMSEVRKAQVGDPGTSGLVQDQRLELTTDAGVRRIYSLVGQELMMTVDDPIAPEPVRLAGNIESLRFSTNGDSVSMLVTVKVGSNSATLSGSAVPRRIMQFQ